MKKTISLIISIIMVLTLFSSCKKAEKVVVLSKIADKKAQSFCVDGDNYRFAITKENKIVIAYKDKAEELTDLVSGNEIYLNSDQQLNLMTIKDVESFESTIVNNKNAIIAKRKADGLEQANANIETTFIFYDRYISTITEVNYSNQNYEISNSSSKFMLKYEKENTKKANYISNKWVYPEDNDFPYPDFDGVVFADEFGDYTVSTILRDNGGISTLRIADLKPDEIPMVFEKSKGLNYKIKYDIVVSKKDKDRDINNDAIFTARNADLAVKIEPVKKEEDNSTVFQTKSMDFNVFVQNLTEKEVLANIKYNVMDYYGNVIDKGLFENSTIIKGVNAKRKISVNAKNYGMYWLNIVVSNAKTKYQECYPFAFIEKYDYKKTNSPFGITAIHFTPNEKNVITLANKIGVANTRLGISNLVDKEQTLNAAKLFKQNNIKLNGMNLYWNPPTDGFEYEASIKENYPDFEEYLDSVEVGNENSMRFETNSGTGFDEYVETVFTPGYNAIKKKFNQKYMVAAIAGPDEKWIDLLYQKGLWDKFDIISYHPYGFPVSPDGNFDVYWHTESAMKKLNAKLDKYGRKPIYVTEIGYPTVPKAKALVELRTQADYLVRQFMVCLRYKAERIQWYSFFDLAFGSTFNVNDNEYHFGTFYAPDSNGTIKPKPSAIAFSTMARLLDEYQSCYEVENASKTVKEYRVATKSGEVSVLWSNSEMLPNNSLSPADRNFIRPWEKNWKDSEAIFMATTKKEVTITDIMGNSKTIKAYNGKVQIELTGSPVFLK